MQIINSCSPKQTEKRGNFRKIKSKLRYKFKEPSSEWHLV